MDTNKLTQYQLMMANNLPGTAKCINSVSSAIVLNISILMPSDVYYPPQQLSFQEKVAIFLIMNAISAMLGQFFD